MQGEAASSPGDEAAPIGATGPWRSLASGSSLKFLWWLAALALLTRIIWVLWIHPPDAYLFSDMNRYVERARELAEHGFRPGVRTFAWQAWGTHALLALPLSIFGKDALVAASVMWALMGAAAVPTGYLLAARVTEKPWMAKTVGVALLLWHPSLSNTGYFLSETPFLFFQLWATLLLVIVVQDGRRALSAGIVSAIAFALRPQSALFYLLVLATWALARRRLRHVLPRHLGLIALPLVAMLAFSFWRFHAHTGYWSGIAENANMNLTAGRCHNIVTQAFPNDAALRRSERDANTRDGRRVSLPGFRLVAKNLPDDHPLALRPAMGSETIRFVGYIGDPQIHRELRRMCYARTGVLEQLRYSLMNVSLLWFLGQQWPEMEQKVARELFVPPLIFFKHFFQIVVWLPSLIGIGIAVRRLRADPALALCAWQLVTSMTVAAIFFGEIRLRTPYDPYAIILAVIVWARVIPWLWSRFRGLASRSSM